jgi:hypothetical protein
VVIIMKKMQMGVQSLLKKKKAFSIFVILIIIISSVSIFLVMGSQKGGFKEISIHDVLVLTSERNPVDDVIITTDECPMKTLVSSAVACWYDIGGSAGNDSGENGGSAYGLKPMLIATEGVLEPNQERFLGNTNIESAILIGEVDYSSAGVNFQATGSAARISIDTAKHVFTSAAGALIIEHSKEGYELGTVAAPMASYLNIPIIIKDSETGTSEIKSALKSLDVKYTIILGKNAENIAGDLGIDSVLLKNDEEITDSVMVVVQHRFGAINYITMTNPADVIPHQVTETIQEDFVVNVNNLKVKLGRTENDIVGESKHTQMISVPEGTNRIQIYINFTSINSKPLDPLKDAIEVDPMIFAYLYDSSDRLAAYAPSFSLDVGRTYLETQSFNVPGDYRLETEVYYGTRGFDTYAGTGFGVSNIEATYEISAVISELERPHNPIYPKMSMMAPYLSASRGGVVLANPEFGITTDDYEIEAEGFATGPNYELELHPIVNKKVNYVVKSLNHTLEHLQDNGLLESYLDGPAWLAILAGPNMIPQYYFPKEANWVEDVVHGTGWPSDIVYSSDLRLSVGRPLGSDVGEVSTLIARTLFYKSYSEGHAEMIKQEYGSSENWGDNFHFLAGELGGRTGWFFWQREFAPEVEQHGFQAEEYYQNHENDRQYMIANGAYERANYFDMMMHGNWYWYTTEINGMDTYSTSVKNSDISKSPNDWELGPSMFLTGSCLLGRIDGISPDQQITMAFIEAGINALFSASRTTGSEAKAGIIEMGLIYQDVSVGEALRLDKQTNREPSTFYVRSLFGDPAFNPYEPENGYANQGRPNLISVFLNSDTNSVTRVPADISAKVDTRSTQTNMEEDEEDEPEFEYHTYEQVSEELHRMEQHHPEIAALYSIGTTYEGRDIWAMKVSDNPKEQENEPEVLFTGAHHGREWPSYEVPFFFLKFILENYGREPTDNDNDGLINEDIFDGIDNDDDGEIDEDEDEARISWLVDCRQIWIVPIVNPDGVAYAHAQVASGHADENTLWRKNREPNINPVTGSPYPEEMGGKDMWGTDLNRNYGFHWGEFGYQGYADPSREDYIGPHDKTDDDNDRRLNEDKMDNIDNDGDGKIDEDPIGGFSTTETIAIKTLVEEHNFVIALNFHTYGDVIYWPWMWTLELPPDEELYFQLAKGMSNFNGYGYRNMSERAQSEFSRHPPVDGDSNDWMYGKHNILAYTIEIGTQFIPPASEIPDICRLHLGANLYIVEVAENPWQRKVKIGHEPLKDTTNTEGYSIKAVIDNDLAPELMNNGIKVYYSTNGASYKSIVMEPGEEWNEYEAKIPGQNEGDRISYYISVLDVDEHITQLPKYAPHDKFTFTVLSSRGEASASILWTHVIFIVGAIIFVLGAAFYGLMYLRTGRGINKAIQMAGITTGMVFIGGFPLGFALAYQVYGVPWTGVPFGWDITDNKTLVILLFFSISLFLVRGTVIELFTRGRGRFCPFKWLGKTSRKAQGRESKPMAMKDSISHHRFAKLTIIGAVITVALYLVPHSLMVSPGFSIFLFVLLIGIFVVPDRSSRFD